ncbi:MAG: IS982 family transposase [Cyanobacteria bacterium J06576_12]
MFDIEEFIIAVYVQIDARLTTLLDLYPARARGFEPSLSDAEVITLEVVGEFLGYHTDIGIWRYFRRHWASWFPSLGHRSTFVRQAANLWAYKQQLHQQLLKDLRAEDADLFRVDGFPIPVCGFKRAPQCQVFKGDASFGKSATKLGTFYGFKGHLLINADGLIMGLGIAAANVDERDLVPELVTGLEGLLLGDKGYLRPALTLELAKQGLQLLTPTKRNMKQQLTAQQSQRLCRCRQLVETVIGHLCHWFDIERIRARDLWHLTSRLARKLLAHTLMVFLNRAHQRSPLHFDGIILD